MDKNKIIEAAAKLVAKGAYDKAIKEYQKVLEADPKDVRVLQKMGELFQKKNDNAQAARYFIKVAESYSSDGFFLKAVALYKQVLKLDPTLIDVNLKLAELHQQLGLMSESMAYFQIVANHYDKQGDTRSSLDTLKKMVDLDPDNVSSRIKLAELYARENMNREAIQEFKRAAEYLKRNNRTDDYVRVAERLSALDQDNVPLARELAQSYLAKGDQKRALAKLQVCFKLDPRDVETLKLLAEAFQGLGQTPKTVSVYKELAKVYSDKGQTSDANGVWSRIAQLDPSDADVIARRPAAASAPAARAPTPAPAAPVPAPSRSAPAAPVPAPAAASPAPSPRPAPPASAPPGRDQLSKLLTETDVYVKYGLHDKALEHLRRVFAIDPENLDAHEKAYHIYVSANNEAQSSEQLLNVLRLCTRRHEVERAQPYLATMLETNPDHPEVPAFLAELQVDEEHSAPTEAVGEDAILVDSNEEEIIVAEAPEDALASLHNNDLALQSAAATVHSEDDVIEDDRLVDDEPVVEDDDEPLLTDDGSLDSDEPMSMGLDDGGQVVDDEELSVDSDEDGHSMLVSSEDEEDEQGVTENRALPSMMQDPLLSTQPSFARHGREAEPLTDPGSLADSMPDSDEELTSETVVVARSAVSKPAPVPAKPAAIAAKPAPVPAKHAPIAAKPAPVAAKPAPVAAKPAPVAAKPAPVSKPDATVRPPVAKLPEPRVEVEESVEAPEDELPAAEECDEAGFFLDQGLLEEARDILETVLIAYPNHAQAQELMARLEGMESASAGADEDESPASQPASEGGKDAFDLAAELADELSDLGGSEEPAAASGEDFQYSVEEVFAEFKKGLEKVVKPEDVETHYDLGIAYKEMGLLDDAIGEFGVAREGCLGKKKEVDCLTMTGLIQMMQGQPDAAVGSFREALTSEHAAGEVGKALQFELGTALEAMGEAGKALYHFQAVANADPRYRDAGSIVERLSATAEAEEDPVPKVVKSNGANGAHAAKPGSAAPPAPANKAPVPDASAPGKARKVGYV